jgi:hypothetical protein
MITNHRNEIELLNDAFTWKYNSLAAYILAAEPYVPDSEESLRQAIAAIAEEDLRLRDEIAQVLEDLEAVVRIKPYDHMVSDLNYLSLEYLRGVLKEELGRQLAAYEQSESESTGQAKEMFAELIQRTRAQAAKL